MRSKTSKSFKNLTKITGHCETIVSYPFKQSGKRFQRQIQKVTAALKNNSSSNKRKLNFFK